MKVNYIPEGCRAVNPYLHVVDAARLIDFLKTAFGGTERMRITGPNGTVAHAQISIGDSLLMVCERHEPWPARSIMLYHYVPDVEATYRQALAAGAQSVFAPMNMFYGDRLACVKDFAGNDWAIATHVEEVSPEQMQKMTGGQ